MHNKEKRLEALLEMAPEVKAQERVDVKAPTKEVRPLGEGVGFRNCPNVTCTHFAVKVPVLCHGEETVKFYKNEAGNVTSRVENSWLNFYAVDDEDMKCDCGSVSFIPPGSKSVLEGVVNPAFGVNNDRDAVNVARRKKDLPLLTWED